MKGYYKMPKETEEVLNEGGWFNTGDKGYTTPLGLLKITGRYKDTIALRNGENVEPVPIEDALQQSPYIDSVVILGSDTGRSDTNGRDVMQIGALIVPNFESLQEYCGKNGIDYEIPQLPDTFDQQNEKIYQLYRNEINRLVNGNRKFQTHESIGPFRLLPKQFVVGEELTETFKVKRYIFPEMYSDLIKTLDFQTRVTAPTFN